MKKILSLITLLILFSSTADAQDYSNLCTKYVPDKNFKGTLTSITGFNLLTKNIIEHQISKRLKKELNSDFKVKIDSFYGNNILNGEFKNLTAEAKSVVFNNFYISNIKANTICDYNHVEYIDNKIIFKENMPIKYSSQVTQDDLNKTLESTEYKKIINKMNNSEYISSLFDIKASKIEIKDNKIILKYEIIPLSILNTASIIKIKPINVNLKANLKAENGKIVLCDVEVNSKKQKHLPKSLETVLNPLEYDVKVSKNNKGKLTVEKTEIKDNIINIEGYMLIFKD